MQFHVQILESQFPSLYHGLHMIRQGVMLPISTTSARHGQIPDFEVEQAMDQIGGMVTVCSPPPIQHNKFTPGTPVPKGEAHLTLTKLSELEKKEFAVVDCKGNKTQKRMGVALKRKNETDS